MSQIIDLIKKKADGVELAEDEIKYFIDAFKDGTIGEAQASALVTAWTLKGMTTAESKHMAQLLLNCEKVVRWPIPGYKEEVVNLHIVGDFNDKVTLVLMFALAASGIKCPVMSVKCLGYTGSLLEKVESMSGFNGRMPLENMIGIIEDVGCCIMEQPKTDMSTARRLSDLCHLTGCNLNIHMMIALLLARKSSQNPGLQITVISYGKASPVSDVTMARDIAKVMLEIAEHLKLNLRVMLLPLDHPVGRMLGNSVEVKEALNCLMGKGPEDLHSIVCKIGGQILYDLKKAESEIQGESMIDSSLKEGVALAKLTSMCRAQSVDRSDLEQFFKNPKSAFNMLFPQAPFSTYLTTTEEGYVEDINADVLENVLGALGAGRQGEGQAVNRVTGIELNVDLGQHLKKGDQWGMLYHETRMNRYQHGKLATAIKLSQTPVPSDDKPLKVEVITPT